MANAADYLKPVQRQIPTVLVDEQYSHNILTVAKSLPMVSLISYECRLAQDAQQVDLALCAFGRNDGLTIKEMSIPTRPYEEDNKQPYRTWQNIKEFGSRWLDSNNFLQSVVSAFWMNVDIKEEISNIPEPWFYVIFADIPNAGDLKKVLVKKTLQFLEHSFPDFLTEQLQECISLLPDKAHLLGLGLQSTRNVQTLRLVIYKMDLKEMRNFLNVSGWSDDAEIFEQQLQTFALFADSLGFIFDVDTDGICPLVGIELYPGRSAPGALEELLRLLVKRELCSPLKAKAVMSWVNSKSDMEGLVDRWVSHIKLTYNSGKIVMAKIYLYHQFDLEGPINFQFL